MANLSEALDSALGPTLMEASLGRIWQHNKDRAFVILTSWRGNQDKETNEKNLAALKKKIRSAGFGFIPVDGVGQEESGPAIEPSLIVVSRKDAADKDGEFLAQALAWGKAYDQYAIFYHVVRNGEPQSAVVNCASGSTEVDLHSFKPNEIGTFYTKLKNKGTFKYEHIGVKWGERPKGWIHGMGLEAQGEIDFEMRESFDDWLHEMERLGAAKIDPPFFRQRY